MARDAKRSELGIQNEIPHVPVPGTIHSKISIPLLFNIAVLLCLLGYLGYQAYSIAAPFRWEGGGYAYLTLIPWLVVFPLCLNRLYSILRSLDLMPRHKSVQAARILSYFVLTYLSLKLVFLVREYANMFVVESRLKPVLAYIEQQKEPGRVNPDKLLDILANVIPYTAGIRLTYVSNWQRFILEACTGRDTTSFSYDSTMKRWTTG
jgi:hypothetical protein